jgi:hypothetical protein
MKRWFMKFAVSRLGIVAIPILSALIASGLAKLAALSPELAGQVDPREVAGWVWGVILAALTSYAIKEQGEGVLEIQKALNATPVIGPVKRDRYAGPVLRAEARHVIALAEGADPLQHAFGNPDKPTPPRPARKKVGWWKR